MAFTGSILVLISLALVLAVANAIRDLPSEDGNRVSSEFIVAPKFVNQNHCKNHGFLDFDHSVVHIAMTLDSKYLRGSMAAVHSILRHSSCPESIRFHFVVSRSGSSDLDKTVRSTFPSLDFKIYPFDEEERLKKLISSSIRHALDQPLNYARIYLAGILDSRVHRVIYLDSDTIMVDDVQKLWAVDLSGSKVIGAPEYCHVDFTKYFRANFWKDPILSSVFKGKKPCYFNTGVMIMDLQRWRSGEYTKKMEEWMKIQKEKRIYELGSLPPFLLVFGGEIEGIDHRWNQHGLGGDNVENSCRRLHSGPASLLHWSGKGKPWVRLDEGNPCPVDHLWAPYDLYKLHHK